MIAAFGALSPPFFSLQPAFPERYSASDSPALQEMSLRRASAKGPAGQTETKGWVKDGTRWREMEREREAAKGNKAKRSR